MHARQTLPETYRKVGSIDLKQDNRLMILLNVAGLLVMFGSGYLFFRAIVWLRSGEQAALSAVFQFQGGWLATLGLILAALVLTAVNVVVHEAIHGVFFWWFTGARPVFAFRGAYAYAAAPDWYLPRNQYFVTSLAPLVFISLIGLALFRVVPVAWLPSIWFVLISNAGGAVGDLAVSLWLVRQPEDCLAQDYGDAVSLYLPEAPRGEISH